MRENVLTNINIYPFSILKVAPANPDFNNNSRFSIIAHYTS